MITKPVIWCYEVITRVPSQTDADKKVRCGMLVCSPDFETLMEYLGVERMDSATEIECINRIGPIVAVLEARKAGDEQPT